MEWTFDRTLLNILSLTIGAVSLYAALTGYNVPEVNHSFFNSNPFQIKRDIIASWMTALFMGVAVVAVLIQIGMAIFDLPEKEKTVQSSTLGSA